MLKCTYIIIQNHFIYVIIFSFLIDYLYSHSTVVKIIIIRVAAIDLSSWGEEINY